MLGAAATPAALPSLGPSSLPCLGAGPLATAQVTRGDGEQVCLLAAAGQLPVQV